MEGWDTLNCVNHPERMAIERCEVCNVPLCAYCLYYTEDGQRLCALHAEQARRRGLHVEEPGAYAEQLIGAQAGAVGKHKRAARDGDGQLYRGNSHDLFGLIGLLVGGISLLSCCGMGYCLPVIGFLLSLVAVINARHAYDPARTRKLGVAGLLLSGVWVLLIGACILFYGVSLQRMVTASFQTGPVQVWGWPPSDTPAPTSTPTLPATPGFGPVATKPPVPAEP